MHVCMHTFTLTHAHTHCAGDRYRLRVRKSSTCQADQQLQAAFQNPKGLGARFWDVRPPLPGMPRTSAMSLLVVCRPDLPGRCYVHSRGAQLPSQVPFTGVTANSCACRGTGVFPGVRAAHGHSQHSPSPTLRPWHRARFPMSYMMSLGFNTQTKVMSRSHRSKRLQAGPASRSRCQTAGSGGV